MYNMEIPIDESMCWCLNPVVVFESGGELVHVYIATMTVYGHGLTIESR